MAKNTVTPQINKRSEPDDCIRTEMFLPKPLYRRLKIHVATIDGGTLRQEVISAIEQYLAKAEIKLEITGERPHGKTA